MTVARRVTRSMVSVAVALVAGGVLLARAPDDRAAPPSTATATTAWPDADRAEISKKLPDGTTFVPGHFLDARTAVGSAASPDGRMLRLVLRVQGRLPRELRSLPRASGLAYGSFAAAGTRLVWVESIAGSAPHIWTVDLRDPPTPARRLTTDTGEAVFRGSQHDLVIEGGRVIWVAVPGDGRVTEVRSIALTGGPVAVRTEEGLWTMAAWPWLTDGNDTTSRVRLRNTVTGRDLDVDTGSGTELITCSPAWCRVTAMDTGGISRIDLMRHDGSARTTVAGRNAGVVDAQVAVLDRFELHLEAQAGAEGETTTALLAYDIAAARTVEISPAVQGAVSRAGMLWWSTGDGRVWQVLDLRTV